MKYLLSILVLFSGLSFAESDSAEYKYLICDEPYYFYPDLSKRKIIDMTIKGFLYKSEIEIRSIAPLKLSVVKFEHQLFIYDETKYQWKSFNQETQVIDRMTGKYGDLQCKSVDGYDSDEAHGELIQYAKELKAKRKI